MPDQKLKIRNPPLKPEIVEGLSQLASHYSGPDDPAVVSAIEWIQRVVANERNRLAMEDTSGTFQIWERQSDGSEKPIYGSELTQPLVKMYLRMQKLGMKVRVTRDGRPQVITKSAGTYVIGDEIDFDN